MKAYMKNIVFILAGVLLAPFAFADATSNVNVGIDQGGNNIFVKSGGTVTVESGGTMDVQAGSTMTVAADMTPTGALDLSSVSSLSIPPGGFSQGADQGHVRASVTVSSAEILALNAAPKTLVAAPGAGKALILQGAYLFMDYATTAYDGIAAAEDLSIKYTDGSGVEVAQIETTGFLDQANDERRYGYASSAAAIEPAFNAPLVLHLLTGEIATGDSPVEIVIYYKIIDDAE